MASTLSETVKPETLPRVVIVGGGFAGLYAAKGLAQARVQVTLIDKHCYHMFRPLMYQVATGILAADEAGRGGRVKVNADLSVPGLPNVFVIGDTADVVAEWRNLLG